MNITVSLERRFLFHYNKINYIIKSVARYLLRLTMKSTCLDPSRLTVVKTKSSIALLNPVPKRFYLLQIKIPWK